MNIKYVSRFIYLFSMLIFISSPSFCANRYWVGSGLGNWNNTANWSNASGGSPGFSVPGLADLAIFDGGSTTNCKIDANINVDGFTISASYSGTISVNANITVTVAASGFSQTGGIFMGNNGNISINGAFHLAGGTFVSSAGVLQIIGGYTYTAGIFKHNNGTVSFSTTQTITGNTSFYDILFVANGGIYTVANGTTISSSNDVTIRGAFACIINTGIIEIMGDLTLTSSANNSLNGGTATFLFDGPNTQNIYSSFSSISVGTNEKVCALPNIEINKTSGSLNLNGLINISGTFWKTTAGAALINPHTSTVNINSSVTFSGENLSLYNIHIYANSQLITLSPISYILTSTQDVTINGGSFYELNTGTLEILGNLTLVNTGNSAINGGTGTFLFDGVGVQNINSSASVANNVGALPNVLINKTSGVLNLIGIINFSGTSWHTMAGAALINAGTSTINILKLSTLSGQNLTLYNIVITGNFSVITISTGLTWTSTHLLTLAGGSDWYQINTGTLNAQGDVLVTNTSTINSSGGNGILLFDGAANQMLTGSGVAGGGRLPQVEINKTGGTLTLSNSIISTDNKWTYIAGNVDAGTHASTVDFYKTGIIDGQGTSSTMAFYHVIFSGMISLGGNMDVDGDFTIRSGVNDKLDVTAANNYQLNVAGNWTNANSVTASSFNQESGKVVFDGAGAQALTLAAATHTEIFYNLEISNSGSGLTLQAPVTVANNIHFISGNIISSTSNILLLTNAATATGANNHSFVSGPVYKTGNQPFIFPVGKNAFYAPIAISAPSANTHQFRAEYFYANPDPFYNVNSKDPSLSYISQCEYWLLDRTVGTSNVTVNLSWDMRSCGITNLNSLRVARWNGTQWKDHGNGGTTGTITAGTVVSAAPVTAFSPFTLASDAPALPVELLSFTARCQDKTAVLDWSTASETNNDFFTVEHSADASHWLIITNLAGGGNSTANLNYSFTDAQPYNGISYYRLKQTNFDGVSAYSGIIDVKDCPQDSGENDFTMYPNPTTGILNFSFNGDKQQVRSIEIYNMLQERIYYSHKYESIIDLSDQQNGFYLVLFIFDKKIVAKKIIVNR